MATSLTLVSPQEVHIDPIAVLRVRVLLLGLEPILQSTRARILEIAGFDCFLACDFPRLHANPDPLFRVLILCQSLEPTKACQIQEALRQTSPMTAVLRLAKRSLVFDPCFAHTLCCPTPSELIAAVQQLARGSEPLSQISPIGMRQ